MQVRFDRTGLEIERGHGRAGCARQETRQFAGDGIGAGLRERLVERAAEVRRRHVVAAHRLGQAADQCRGLVGDETRRQPTQLHWVQGIEQMQRHIQGHAIVVGTRFEAVVQRQARLAQGQVLRIALLFTALTR